MIRKMKLAGRNTTLALAALLGFAATGCYKTATNKPAPSNHVLSLQEKLRDVLGARIQIRQKKNNSGQIVIHFGSNDDFERIVGQLRKAA